MRTQREALDDAEHHAAQLIDALQDADASRDTIKLAEEAEQAVKQLYEERQ
jgi:hypothetical protein